METYLGVKLTQMISQSLLHKTCSVIKTCLKHTWTYLKTSHHCVVILFGLYNVLVKQRASGLGSRQVVDSMTLFMYVDKQSLSVC